MNLIFFPCRKRAQCFTVNHFKDLISSTLPQPAVVGDERGHHLLPIWSILQPGCESNKERKSYCFVTRHHRALGTADAHPYGCFIRAHTHTHISDRCRVSHNQEALFVVRFYPKRRVFLFISSRFLFTSNWCLMEPFMIFQRGNSRHHWLKWKASFTQI